MESNAVLDAAEARVSPAAAMALATRTAIVESMREEIGRSHYEQAKVELPKLELFLAKTVRPYLIRLTKISQGASTPLPPAILAHVRELEESCANAPDFVRVGIAEFNGLQAPYVKGSTREIDLNRRAEEVGSIRMKLTNWSGREGRMRDLMAYINNFIEESGWPASAPSAAA